MADTSTKPTQNESVSWKIMHPTEGHDQKHDMNLVGQVREQSAKADSTQWRQEYSTAINDMKQLKTMSDNDPKRADLINQIDKAFQQSIPQMGKDATQADANLFKSMSVADNWKKNYETLMNDPDVKAALPQGDKTPITTLKEEAQYAQNPQTQAKLADLYALCNESAIYKNGTIGDASNSSNAQVVDNYWKSSAPAIASMQYAEFLMQYKGGVSKDSNGQSYSAADVLGWTSGPEAQSAARQNGVQPAAADASAANRALLIDPQNDPFTYINKVLGSNESPQQQLADAQKAQQITQDNAFAPNNIQQDLQQLQGDNSTQGQQKLNALQQFSHARGFADLSMGYALLNNGQNSDAQQYLQKAGQDSAVQALKDSRGNSILQQLTDQAGKPAEQTTLTPAQKAQQDYQTNYQAIQADSQKYSDLQNNKQISDKDKGDQEKKLLNDMTTKAEAMVKDGQTIKDNGGGQSAMSQAKFMLASFDFENHNVNAAKDALDQIKKDDPNFVKQMNEAKGQDGKPQNAFDDMYNTVKNQYDHDHENWFEKGWDDFTGAVGSVVHWLGQHGKMVAFAVGAIAAAGIVTVATGGLGAPVGVAIVAGVIGGGIAGTAAGATAEVAGGQKKSFLSAVGDVAPSAFAGSVTGALTMGSASAVGAGGEAAVAANAGSKIALPGVQAVTDALGGGRAAVFAGNALRGAEIWGAYSGVHTYDDIKSGKVNSVGGAFTDFLSTDIQAGGTQALFGTKFAGGKLMSGLKWFGADVAKNGVAESLDPRSHNGFGSYLWNVGADSAGDVFGKQVFNFAGKIGTGGETGPGFWARQINKVPGGSFVTDGFSTAKGAVGNAIRSVPGGDFVADVPKYVGAASRNAAPLFGEQFRDMQNKQFMPDKLALGIDGANPSVDDLATMTGYTPNQIRELEAQQTKQQQELQQQLQQQQQQQQNSDASTINQINNGQ